MPRTANLLARSPLGILQRRRLGIHRNRRLPQLSTRTFRELTDGRYGPRRVDVALFVDTFTQWLEPDIGLAALDYLDAAGAHPAVAPNVCCGRTYISAGMLDEARQLAVENVRRLLPLATSGVPIVGLEPSCILTLRDELTKLLPGDDDARTVSRHVLLFEEALDRWETPRLNPLEAAVIVHPHCHTKALARPGATAEAMRRIPAARVEMLDAGCCGMAGSFGYRSETYDLSVAMAKDRAAAGRERQPGRDRGRPGHVVPQPDRRPRSAPRRASGAAAGRSARGLSLRRADQLAGECALGAVRQTGELQHRGGLVHAHDDGAQHEARAGQAEHRAIGHALRQRHVDERAAGRDVERLAGERHRAADRLAAHREADAEPLVAASFLQLRPRDVDVQGRHRVLDVEHQHRHPDEAPRGDAVQHGRPGPNP